QTRLGREQGLVLFVRAGLGHQQELVSEASPRNLGEDAGFQVDGKEEVPLREQHLNLAQEEVAGLIQSEVEPSQNPRLRLKVEVHQRVATHEEIEPRDRRILEKVVTAEYHRPSEVG